MAKKKKAVAKKATPAAKRQTDIKAITFNTQNGSVLGLGSDNKVYVWNTFDGNWLPVRMNAEQRAAYIASQKAPANADAPAAPAALG